MVARATIQYHLLWFGVANDQIELARYVTPYAASLDVLLDVSHYAPLLLADELEFYSFIDTWVGNATPPELWQENGTCSLREMEGNGWAFSAELLYWPTSTARTTEVVPIIPRRGVPLGEVRAQQTELLVEHGAVTFAQHFRDQKGVVFAPCRGVEELKSALREDWAARTPDRDAADILLRSSLGPARPAVELVNASVVRVKLEAGDVWAAGDAAFVQKRAPTVLEDGRVVNGVAPLDPPAGRVVAVEGNSALVAIVDGCLPDGVEGWRFQHAPKAVSVPDLRFPLHAAIPSTVAAQVRAQSAEARGVPVCILTRAPGGVSASAELAPRGGRVFARVLATGHGWSLTRRHCGEYCQVEYTLTVNGREVGVENPWRECADNPTGAEQHGTWDEARNGWCPGAVSAGWDVDVTDAVPASGLVQLSLTARVVNAARYNNTDGFAFGEDAKVETSVTLFRVEPTPTLIQRDRVVRRASPEFNPPWFTYEEPPEPEARVTAFAAALQQGASREITARVPGPGLDSASGWTVGLRLRLGAPPAPLRVDRWDRLASFGVRPRAGTAKPSPRAFAARKPTAPHDGAPSATAAPTPAPAAVQ